MKFSSTVVRGNGIGKTLGFPTANLKISKNFSLPYGVYAVKAFVNKKWYKGALHFGPRFVYGEEKTSLEVHLLNFSDDIYGKKINVEVIAFLRDVKKFPSHEELKEQIKKDCLIVDKIISVTSNE